MMNKLPTAYKNFASLYIRNIIKPVKPPSEGRKLDLSKDRTLKKVQSIQLKFPSLKKSPIYFQDTSSKWAIYLLIHTFHDTTCCRHLAPPCIIAIYQDIIIYITDKIIL